MKSLNLCRSRKQSKIGLHLVNSHSFLWHMQKPIIFCVFFCMFIQSKHFINFQTFLDFIHRSMKLCELLIKKKRKIGAKINVNMCVANEFRAKDGCTFFIFAVTYIFVVFFWLCTLCMIILIILIQNRAFLKSCYVEIVFVFLFFFLCRLINQMVLFM